MQNLLIQKELIYSSNNQQEIRFVHFVGQSEIILFLKNNTYLKYDIKSQKIIKNQLPFSPFKTMSTENGIIIMVNIQQQQLVIHDFVAQKTISKLILPIKKPQDLIQKNVIGQMQLNIFKKTETFIINQKISSTKNQLIFIQQYKIIIHQQEILKTDVYDILDQKCYIAIYNQKYYPQRNIHILNYLEKKKTQFKLPQQNKNTIYAVRLIHQIKLLIFSGNKQKIQSFIHIYNLQNQKLGWIELNVKYIFYNILNVDQVKDYLLFSCYQYTCSINQIFHILNIKTNQIKQLYKDRLENHVMDTFGQLILSFNKKSTIVYKIINKKLLMLDLMKKLNILNKISIPFSIDALRML